jgi:hypothetical protein
MASRLPLLRTATLALLLALLLGGLVTAEPAAGATPPVRYIDVSVATLWVQPGTARSVDAPACANPANPRKWVESMTVTQKRWLVGRLETQALYGTKVYVLGRSGSWTRIAVPSQPTPRNKWGYPGWVPSVQLATTAPQAAPRVAVVQIKTVWLRANGDLTGRVMELSYGTRLPAVAWTTEAIEVVALDGRRLYLPRSAARLQVPGEPWPVLTGATLVAHAKRFLGLQYLWAGTSGFGFDCSGFTHLVHRTLGKTIPRDGGPQFAAGKRIASRSSLRAGDLVFFRNSAGSIHHVGMYIGGGKMIHSPRTGQPVATVSIWVEPYRSEFAGGSRFTP